MVYPVKHDSFLSPVAVCNLYKVYIQFLQIRYIVELIKNCKNLLTIVKDCGILLSASEVSNTFIAISASGSVGGVQPCQGWGRGFESRLALFIILKIKKSYFGRKLPE